MRHKFQQGKKRLGRDLNPKSQQDNEKTNNFLAEFKKTLRLFFCLKRKRNKKKEKKGEKRKEKEERKENEKKEKRGKPCMEGKEKKKEKGKGLQFPMFRRLEVASLRIKVGILDKSYE